MRAIRLGQTALAMALTTAALCGDAQAQAVFATLYDFGAPVSPTNLIAGPNGVLYGAANNAVFGGAVFQLTPPAVAGQAWNMTVLYTLTDSDGKSPAAIVLGRGGAIFGTTNLGGGPANAGIVFELTPPATAGGNWTLQILHIFGGFPDGNGPAGSLAVGPNGEIYGATTHGGVSPIGSGTVFAVTPPATTGGSWTETILYRFTGGADGALPVGGVVLGPDGFLYGTTAEGGAFGFGTVFQLRPPLTPGAGWTEAVLYSFGGGFDGSYPEAVVLPGPNGRLYGTTRTGGTAETGFNGDGTVFELKPPPKGAGAWIEDIIYRFQPGFPTVGYYPTAPVVMGANGAIYGTTCCGGTVYGVVFELQPPISPGGAWTETVLHTFLGGADSGSPYQGLLIGPGGVLYGTTTGIGTSAESATIFAVEP